MESARSGPARGKTITTTTSSSSQCVCVKRRVQRGAVTGWIDEATIERLVRPYFRVGFILSVCLAVFY